MDQLKQRMKHSREEKQSNDRDDAADHPGHTSDRVLGLGDDVSLTVRTAGATWLVAVVSADHFRRRYHHCSLRLRS